jgi:hypothetical protein
MDGGTSNHGNYNLKFITSHMEVCLQYKFRSVRTVLSDSGFIFSTAGLAMDSGAISPQESSGGYWVEIH